MRRSYSMELILAFSLLITIASYSLPYFFRVLFGIFSLILIPGYVLSSLLFRQPSKLLRNLTVGTLLALIYLTLFGYFSLTFLETRKPFFHLLLYFLPLFAINWLINREYKLTFTLNKITFDKYDKYFLIGLLFLMISVSFQGYFMGYETKEGFVSKFTRNDHWYYASSSAEIKNLGLSSYPMYPHLPPNKERYPIASFILFAILSLLLNVPTLYVVQYFILVPLALSFVFYYGAQLFFKNKKAAFYTFLFGSIFHLGWIFFLTPMAFYRYQSLQVPLYLIPAILVCTCLFVLFLAKVYNSSKHLFYGIILLIIALGGIASWITLSSIIAKLGKSIYWLIPALYYEWTYDFSFQGMLPLQLFFQHGSPKALSLLYQAMTFLILYQIICSDKRHQRIWQCLLILVISIASVTHTLSFVAYSFFLAVLAIFGIFKRSFRPLTVPIVLGGLISAVYILYYAMWIVPEQNYLIFKPTFLYPLIGFIVFYGFHWIFSYYGVKSLYKKRMYIPLLLLSIHIFISILYIHLAYFVLRPDDMGRVLSVTLVSLAFLSGFGACLFNQRVKPLIRTSVWIILILIGACYFFIYPLTFSPLQPSQYQVPAADLEAYSWIRSHTSPHSLFVVSLNLSEYNPHELTVFGERKTLIDSPYNLEVYKYPKEKSEKQIEIVEEIYQSNFSKESLQKLRQYVHDNMGLGIPIYIFVGAHEYNQYPLISKPSSSLIYDKRGVQIIGG